MLPQWYWKGFRLTMPGGNIHLPFCQPLAWVVDDDSNKLKTPELRRRLGHRAQQKVRERHEIDMTAPNIVRMIHTVLKASAQ